MEKRVIFFLGVSILTLLGCKNSSEDKVKVARSLPSTFEDNPKKRLCNFTDVDGNVLQLKFDPINNWVEISVDQNDVILPYIDTQESGSFKDDVYEFINMGDQVRLLKEDQLIFSAPFNK